MSEDVERELLRAADRVSIDMELLGAASEQSDQDAGDRDGRRPRLLAGLLWQASTTMVDQLLDDVALLRAGSDSAGWSALVAQSQVLSGLPSRFWPRITPHVSAKFLVVTVDLTSRVSRGWSPLSCVAQELMLRCLLDETDALVEVYEVDLGEYWRDMLEDSLFEDLDHELLYDPALDGFEDAPDLAGPPGMAPMDFDHWFVPFNVNRRLPPYAEDQPPTATR